MGLYDLWAHVIYELMRPMSLCDLWDHVTYELTVYVQIFEGRKFAEDGGFVKF